MVDARLWPALLLVVGVAGCRRQGFPETPAGYREYAYVANAGAGTVSVLDLVGLKLERTVQVGGQPAALAANPVRNEIYAVNGQAGSVSVIDAGGMRVVATIGVRRGPGSIAVDPTGHRAYVANMGSSSISVIDLDQRREVADVATKEPPGVLELSPDGGSLLVPHRAAGAVSVFAVSRVAGRAALSLRAGFSGCPGAGSVAILPDSSKAFVACSEGHEVMAIDLAMPADSWAVKQDSGRRADRLMAMMDVGLNPVFLTMKPDGGEIFVSNGAAGSLSEIATQTNEVGGTSMIGNHPAAGIVSKDNSTLFVANSGDDAIGLYSIDDGKLVSSLHTGSAPGALAFSADEHLLLALDTKSGDVSVIRTQSRLGPSLFTILPAGMGPVAIVTKVIGQGKS